MKGLPSQPATLEVEHLTVRFGGLTAVRDVSLRGAAGMVTGLIGPNGAGKTTTFNACTGVVPVVDGSVRLAEETLDGHSSARRAELGLGRTFQRMQLFDTMTVLENVALGLEARLAGRHWWSQIRTTGRERVLCQEAAEDALARCGIEHLAEVVAAHLTTGQRRLVEMARAIASRFRFLLLDEPSSGLDEAETANFSRIVQHVAAQDGVGVLLVEHDITLVRTICGYIYVLDFGQLIFEGPTDEVMASEVVHAAYLGAEDIGEAVA
jgi:ABC-type branched-subunit amino acid transport system ATPase component